MKKYGIISIVFLLLSTLGAIYLVKHNQDIRNRATDETCSPVGQKLCQKNTQGKNTGFQCECIPFASQTSGVWRCTTKNLSTCPTESGSTDATSGTYTTGCVVDGVVVGTITGRCITAVSGKSLPQMWKYKCPGRTDLSGGCQENEQIIAAGSSSVCFENNFCGSQQIDGKDWDTCFMSVVDNDCISPTTKITKPSSTPTPKLTSTPTPGPSSTPTLTPTITPTPTPGPSSTPTPTSTITPTPTPGPSSTPTVTPTGPTPTRIILPQSGVEFPSQILTIVGGIVTLLGFLILL